MTITASSGLSKDEVSRMQEEAEQYEEEDKKKLEQINTRNTADSLAYSIEKTLNENEAKIPDDTKADVRLKIENLREALKTEDYDTIKSLHDELMQASYKMSEALYKDANVAEPVVESPPVPNEDVIEAEVVE